MLRAQVSFEFLLVTTAFLAVLGLFVGVFQTVSVAGALGLESTRAVAFADSFVHRTELLAVLGNDSQTVLPVVPKTPWMIRIAENQLTIEFEFVGKTKTVERSLSLSAVFFEEFLDEPAVLELSTQNGFLVVNRQAN